MNFLKNEVKQRSGKKKYKWEYSIIINISVSFTLFFVQIIVF